MTPGSAQTQSKGYAMLCPPLRVSGGTSLVTPFPVSCCTVQHPNYPHFGILLVDATCEGTEVPLCRTRCSCPAATVP